ncbi:MAG: hypothetical protein SF028_14575 [Candidatus Sumerlaeia bacterium]|nr:hypothetical protein [Candidatus Sumerlaeia bacterium]
MLIKDDNQYRALFEKHLVPMLSGSVLLPDLRDQRRTPSQPVARLGNSQSLGIQAREDDKRRFVLWRSQAFGNPEIELVRAFVEELRSILNALDNGANDQTALNVLLENLPTRTVVSRFGILRDVADQVVRRMILLSQRSYEGKPITVAVAIDPSRQGDGAHVADYFRESFAPVLTNGTDTALFVGANARVCEYGVIPAGGGVSEEDVFAPIRFARIANWARDGRVAIVLNRLGEILIFSDGCLQFARRSARWHFFTHESGVVDLQRPQAEDVRRKMYLTLLDVSFARTGGGLGVVLAGKRPEDVAAIVGEQNLFDSPSPSDKTSLLARLVTKRFQELPRMVRAELLGIDGATIINHHGDILAVGAIVEVSKDVAGEGGAREKAAKVLSKLGLGVKVSQDGGIQAFVHHEGPSKGKEAFKEILTIS